MPFNRGLASLNDSFEDLFFLSHLIVSLPDDRVPINEKIGARDDDQLHDQEVGDVDSPGWVDHEWGEADTSHCYHEDVTFVEEFQGHVMNVHEGSPVENDYHGEQRKEQIENKLNVLRV